MQYANVVAKDVGGHCGFSESSCSRNWSDSFISSIVYTVGCHHFVNYYITTTYNFWVSFQFVNLVTNGHFRP
jgi:hypothetical protein